METQFESEGDVLVVLFSGRLDTMTSPAAETALLERIEDGSQAVVVDFSPTEYISSSGLRVLLKAAKVMQGKGGRLSLCQANEQILEVLEISGFLSIMPHFPERAEAIREPG